MFAWFVTFENGKKSSSSFASFGIGEFTTTRIAALSNFAGVSATRASLSAAGRWSHHVVGECAGALGISVFSASARVPVLADWEGVRITAGPNVFFVDGDDRRAPDVPLDARFPPLECVVTTQMHGF